MKRKKEFKMPLSHSLKKLPTIRQSFEITQEAMAEELNVCRGTYSNKERGVCPFTIDEGAKMLALLKKHDPKITLEYIFNID